MYDSENTEYVNTEESFKMWIVNKKIFSFMELKGLINAGNIYYLFKKLLLFYLC